MDSSHAIILWHQRNRELTILAQPMTMQSIAGYGFTTTHSVRKCPKMSHTGIHLENEIILVHFLSTVTVRPGASKTIKPFIPCLVLALVRFYPTKHCCWL